MNKLFSCTKCTESFSKASRLNDHLLKIHNQKTTFKCLKCFYFCASLRSLQNHMRDKHSNPDTPCNNLPLTSSIMDDDMIMGEKEHEEIFEIQKLISTKEIGI